MLRQIRKKNKPTPPAGVRRILYWRDHGRCVYCGRDVPLHGFHADHYFPFSRGGKTHIGNLVVACPDCNMRKSYHLNWRMRYPASSWRWLVSWILYIRYIRPVDFL